MSSTVENNPIQLLLVDDHPIVRLGLRALLSLHEDFCVAGSVSTGRDALDLVRTQPIDVALIDLRMPGFSGIETLKEMRVIGPAVRTIVLSSFEFDEEIYAAVQAGARGYLHKEGPPEEIMPAIRAVHAGKLAFPRRITERLSNERMTAGLSAREREVLELVAKGLTNKEVAITLRISQFTVRNHLKHMADKLEVSDRTEAIFVALQTGLITVS